MAMAKPTYFMPVHGEAVHLRAHAQLARKMGLKDEGLGRIARYAIGYTGCVEIDGGYHDALLVSFFETTLESGFSAYVLYEGVGAGDGFMWSDPEPAGEETPLI